ncbi:MAG: zinc-ribbon domain-containing protein [Bacteroidaceae bacterium]|nr:zinc-ribbon domain-containing protein [Bacteroidaceae bacterium]
MDTRFCSHCGTVLPPATQFCPSCGKAVAEAQPGAPQGRSHTTIVVLLSVLVGLAVAALVIAGFHFFGNRGETPADAAQPDTVVLVREAEPAAPAQTQAEAAAPAQVVAGDFPPFVIVSGDNVCLRSRPDEGAKLTGSAYPHLNTGDVVACTGVTRDYYRIAYNNRDYFLPRKYGRPRYDGTGATGVAASEAAYVVIAGDNVCLRSRPDESAKLTGSAYPHLDTGEVYPCLGTTGNYYKIDFDGTAYYIPKQYARPR